MGKDLSFMLIIVPLFGSIWWRGYCRFGWSLGLQPEYFEMEINYYWERIETLWSKIPFIKYDWLINVYCCWMLWKVSSTWRYFLNWFLFIIRDWQYRWIEMEGVAILGPITSHTLGTLFCCTWKKHLHFWRSF